MKTVIVSFAVLLSRCAGLWSKLRQRMTKVYEGPIFATFGEAVQVAAGAVMELLSHRPQADSANHFFEYFDFF